jgi:hypothetical protein
MPWYEAAAWGLLGGFVYEIWTQRSLVFSRKIGPWEHRIDWPVEVLVAVIRSLLGAIVGSIFNFATPLPILVLIFAGFFAPWLLAGTSRLLLVPRMRRIETEAELLDSARRVKPGPSKGVSRGLAEMLEARRAALEGQLPRAESRHEGGGAG